MSRPPVWQMIKEAIAALNGAETFGSRQKRIWCVGGCKHG